MRIYVTRGGGVDEIIGFLQHLLTAYESLLLVDLTVRVAQDSGRDEQSMSKRKRLAIVRVDPHLLSENNLIVQRVLIESPGFWEFIGSLNPLQQLREYLKDRHERRKDKAWREQGEREKMGIENDKFAEEHRKMELDNRVLQTTLLQKNIDTLRSVGYTDAQIRRLFKRYYFEPLSRLAEYQNTGLLESVDLAEVNTADSTMDNGPIQQRT